ncbi:MAG TPA: DUF368 domain-containing protein [Candidatus Lachnoclostridium pullistercoris]|uniref:DUF368 domain-containing protein n=1 Tax=Candidatus Lachnoclostridium pullistercoris TaxID=2838632 RepID=A0A9D2PBA9_9FIRM|nr:DUF368 domain-containing protein [Candidatus Lachnoclostridium pullistercoris]
MKYVKEILRGLLIGVAGIVPGVSGGTLAVSMGVYDQIIGAVSHLFRKPGQSVRILFPYGVGMLVGIGGLAFVIETLFGNFPFATSMAFLGLILGGIPALLKRADFHTDGMKKYMAAVTVFCTMTVAAIAGGDGGAAGELVFCTAGERLLTMGCVGMIASVTMVVPGVSGTMLLMMMGYYQPVLHAFNLVQAGALTGDWQTVLAQQEILLPFTIGLAAGIFLCAKTMETLLNRWESMVYAAVTGLVASSPAVILWGISMGEVGTGQMILGVILLAGGAVLAGKMGE